MAFREYQRRLWDPGNCGYLDFFVEMKITFHLRKKIFFSILTKANDLIQKTVNSDLALKLASGTPTSTVPSESSCSIWEETELTETEFR